jgi:hypothetical protein
MGLLNVFNPSEKMLFHSGLILRHILKLISAFIMIVTAVGSSTQQIIGTTATLIVLCFFALIGSYIAMYIKKFEREDHIIIVKIFALINFFVFINSAVARAIDTSPMGALNGVLVVSILNGCYDILVHIYHHWYYKNQYVLPTTL